MMLDDIATYLISSTAFTLLAGSVGNLVKSDMPDTAPAPDTIIALYETAGVTGSYTFSTSTIIERVWERPRLQILSRSSSYPVARANAQTAYGMLDGVTGPLPTSSGTVYTVSAVQAPFDIGRDKNLRHLVSTNYQVERQA